MSALTTGLIWGAIASATGTIGSTAAFGLGQQLSLNFGLGQQLSLNFGVLASDWDSS